MTEGSHVPGSFRDPSGFVFRDDDVIYRQVNRSFREEYKAFLSSGLYDALTSEGLLIAHEESDHPGLTEDADRVLRPEPLWFVSHPYEWSFGQLKDSALATLRIQQIALDHGMSLRDANAHNVQLVGGRPMLIDSLSFERYPRGRPWVAYRQFCQHFLAPLALAAYGDVRLLRLLWANVDGIPLDLAASLLPSRARRRLGLRLHLVAHAKRQRRHAADATAPPAREMPERSLRGLLDSLANAVRKLSWDPGTTTWSEYYEGDSYTPAAFDRKRDLVAKMIAEVSPSTVWDVGGNVGTFSRLASERGVPTACFDLDEAAVEANYRKVREEREANLLPLVLDLTNPSPGTGWEHRERPSLAARGPADLVFALALVHHLAIGNNVPLPRVAAFFADLARSLVVEFVPKQDPKVQTLLATREDIFPTYTREGFERAFAERFTIERVEEIEGSTRVLYLMRRSG